MEDIETALLTLNALRALGVTLCVDDFGTGYSSLSYLHRLPVGIVKIDRSFIIGVGADGANEPIVRAVLAMTKAMGQRVVAEGVETAAQRDWLRDQGCELAQGWFYGKAARPAELKDWIGSKDVYRSSIMG
jgi:diguanylate cyclase